MKAIKAIISTFSKEETLEFITFLKKKNRRGDTKNIQLFKLIATKQVNEIDIKLYGKPNKNAFHALCKRLKDSLIDFVASKSFSGETSEELDILKLLLASRIFFEHKQYKIAFNTLKKAEDEALSLDLYSILTEIYHTKIQYLHLNDTYNIKDVIKASKKNMRLFEREQQLNMTYASIKEQLKESSNKSSREVLIGSFAAFDLKIDETLTYKSLAQLLKIIAASAKLQNDYYNALPFMKEVYELVSKKEAFSDKYRYHHLEVLYIMGLAHFRNKDFTITAYFLKRMKHEMTLGYKERFKEKYTVLSALNETYTGNVNDAIEKLTSFIPASLDSQLTLTMCLFQSKEYAEAFRVMKSFHHSDNFYEKKAGWVFVIKKSIIEILTLIELDKLDLVLDRLKRFKRNFGSKLKEEGEQRVLRFIEIVTTYYENPKAVTSNDFKQNVESSFEWIGKEREDIFVMSFYAWLKSKMESKDIYKTTLELVQK